MAILASKQTGLFSATSTWAVVDPISYSASEVATTTITPTFLSSAAFTPGAITIDGIGIRLLQTAVVPVGTITARLIQSATPVAGTSVTINVSDVPNGTNSIGGWVFFKFAAPVTLAAATAYNAQIATSTNGQITVYRTATVSDWSRFLRTTTSPGIITVGDSLIVAGEYVGTGTSNTFTVTMDNTATTNFAGLEVAGTGVLNYGTSAATNYKFHIAGMLRTTGNGVFTMGTLATPIPVTSTATLQFINTTNVDFGLEIRGFSTFTTYGATKTGRAYLNTDAAAAATTVTTDVSTGWLSGDTIAIASTTTTVAQTESVTLSANATGTSVPTGALGFAHSGTNPTKAEIINLTRNVKILGTSLTAGAYINNINGPSASVSMNYTEFQFLGSATANKRGIESATTGTGTYSINGCAFKNFEVSSAFGFLLGTSVANTTVNDCVFYRMNASAVAFSASALASVSITNCWAFTNILAGNSLFTYSSALPTFSNIVAVSSFSGFGITISTNDFVSSPISNLTCHSNGAGGISITANSQLSTPPVISNLTMWRNTTTNVSINGCNNLVIDTISTFGSTLNNINFQGNVNTDVTLKNVICNGGVSPTSAAGILFAISCDKISIHNSFFGTVTNHTTADVNSTFVRGFLGANFYNCQFGSPTQMTGLNVASYNSYITSSKHNGVSGVHQTYTPLGFIAKDTTIFDTANLGLSTSTRLVPSTFASPLMSSKIIAVPSGRQLRISVSVRQTSIANGSVYNGMLPQLVVRKNHSLGLTSDTVIATATVASAGAFEIISGLTPIAINDGAFTISLLCNGTAGWVNVDSFRVEVI